MRNRSRLALLLLALTLLLPACGDGGGAGTAPEGDGETAGGGELTTLRVATIPIADLGAYFYAIDQGIFTEHGLDVQNTEAAGGAAAISAMVGGEVDLAYTNNVSVLQTAVEGLPITIACGANENVPEGESDMAAFVASPDVTSPEDLVGGTVATNALNNINHLYARVFLRENGFDPDEVDYVEVPFPEQPAALLEGRIQGTLIPEPFKTQLLEEGATNLGFAYRVGGRPDRHRILRGDPAVRPGERGRGPALLRSPRGGHRGDRAGGEPGRVPGRGREQHRAGA